MAKLKIHTETIKLPGRVLHVARTADRLILATTFPDDDVLQSLAQGVTLPAEVWPQVRASIDGLTSRDGAPT